MKTSRELRMDETPESGEYDGTDRRRSWMAAHLSDEPSPVAESSLLVGVLALGDSTDHLRQKVEEATFWRKVFAAVACVALLLVTMQAFYGVSTYRKLDRLSSENHALLVRAEGQREVVQEQTERIIYCVINIRRHDTDPSMPLDSMCPRATFPAVPMPPS